MCKISFCVSKKENRTGFRGWGDDRANDDSFHFWVNYSFKITKKSVRKAVVIYNTDVSFKAQICLLFCIRRNTDPKTLRHHRLACDSMAVLKGRQLNYNFSQDTSFWLTSKATSHGSVGRGHCIKLCKKLLMTTDIIHSKPKTTDKNLQLI